MDTDREAIEATAESEPPTDGAPEEARGTVSPPPPPSFARRWRDRGVRTAEQLQARAQDARDRVPLIDLGFTLASRVRIVQLSLVSGYLAMRFFILIFPLAYVLIAGFGLATTRDEVVDAAGEVGVTGAVADSIADATATSDRGHWIALFVGLMATAWAGRGTLHAMRIAHAEAWRLDVPKTRYASPGGLPLAGVLVAVALFSTWMTNLRHDGYSPVLLFIVQAAVIGAAWLGVAWLMPRAAGTGWIDLVPGAVLVGVAAPALSITVSLYFAPRLARTQATYGALGVGVVLLTYLLVISWLISLSAELNSGIYAWRTSRRQGTGRPG